MSSAVSPPQRVLFLHSGSEVTGSWTYARALQRAWGDLHQVFWINDGLEGAEPPDERLPLRKKLFPQGILNAIKVAEYVKKNRVTVMHSHSRRANMTAAMASAITGIPYVATIHLSTNSHFFSRLWPCAGDRTIAICENIADNLAQDHGVTREQITLIRNGIDLDLYKPAAGADSPWRQITILGRLSGHRWRAAEAILGLIPDILAQFPDVRFQFAGAVADEHYPALREMLARANTGYSVPRAHWLGFVRDVRELIANTSVMIAAGRSLMESMAMGCLSISLGEESCIGLMTPEKADEARRTNFGDFVARSRGEAHYDLALLKHDLVAALSNGPHDRLRSWGREFVGEFYNIKTVQAKVSEIYASVRPSSSVNSAAKTKDGVPFASVH